MTSKSKSTPPPVVHKHHKKMLLRGSWGPHRGKEICIECNGAFVQWVSTNRN